MKWRENIPLFVGILIPVLMVIFIAGSIYLPKIFSGEKPQYDFLYMTGESFFVQDGKETEYFVQDGKLQKNERPLSEDSTKFQPMSGAEPTLYVYDVSKNISEKISFEDAAKLSLDTGQKSPDGFEVVGQTGGGFPFESYDSSLRFLKGKYYRQELNLQQDTRRGMESPQFLGWVIPNPAP